MDKITKIITRIFQDSDGNFEWAGVAASVALVSLFLSWFHNKNVLKVQKEINDENFKGNVVAKSRIEWIQEVRKRSVDFISSCYSYIDFVNANFDKDDDRYADKMNLKNEIEKNGILLTMYFGPDSGKNNDLLVAMVSNIVDHITNKAKIYEDDDVTKLGGTLQFLTDFLRVYFKAEWKRANGEIKDDEVQGYLEENEIYKNIVDIYQDKLEEYNYWTEEFYEEMRDLKRRNTL